MPRKERKRKTNQRNIETAAHTNCVKMMIYVINHITRFCLDGIELQWVIIQSQAWFRGYDYSAYCYVNFDCVSWETGDQIKMFFAIQPCLIVMAFQCNLI